jgi:aminotransferase EvaB
MISVWSYLEEYKEEKKEIDQAIKKVLTSGKLILGPNVEKFEQQFSKWCGSKYGV